MEENKIIKYEGDGLMKHVGKAIEITNKLLTKSFFRINVIHLEDSSLYARGIREFVIPKIPGASVISINKCHHALNHIKSSLENNEQIDLIITELDHVGMNGYEFAKQVREMEKEYGKRSHILLLAFALKDPLITKGLEEKVFDTHLTKDAGSTELAEYIKGVFLLDN